MSEPTNKPESKLAVDFLDEPKVAKLKNIGFAVVSVVVGAVAGALAQIFQDHSLELTSIILSMLPVWLQGWAGSAVGAGLAALVAWLRARAVNAEREKIVEALETTPPPDIQKFYKK